MTLVYCVVDLYVSIWYVSIWYGGPECYPKLTVNT